MLFSKVINMEEDRSIRLFCVTSMAQLPQSQFWEVKLKAGTENTKNHYALSRWRHCAFGAKVQFGAIIWPIISLCRCFSFKDLFVNEQTLGRQTCCDARNSGKRLASGSTFVKTIKLFFSSTQSIAAKKEHFARVLMKGIIQPKSE